MNITQTKLKYKDNWNAKEMMSESIILRIKTVFQYNNIVNNIFI